MIPAISIGGGCISDFINANLELYKVGHEPFTDGDLMILKDADHGVEVIPLYNDVDSTDCGSLRHGTPIIQDDLFIFARTIYVDLPFRLKYFSHMIGYGVTKVVLPPGLESIYNFLPDNYGAGESTFMSGLTFKIRPEGSKENYLLKYLSQYGQFQFEESSLGNSFSCEVSIGSDSDGDYLALDLSLLGGYYPSQQVDLHIKLNNELIRTITLTLYNY